MDQGIAAANIARGFLGLCFKLDSEASKAEYFDKWIRMGRDIVILAGYDHKHLKYLRDEVHYTAVDCHSLYRKWGNEQAIVVLTVFGQEEDLKDTFHNLSLWR